MLIHYCSQDILTRRLIQSPDGPHRTEQQESTQPQKMELKIKVDQTGLFVYPQTFGRIEQALKNILFKKKGYSPILLLPLHGQRTVDFTDGGKDT